MMSDQPWKDKGLKKADWLAKEVSRAVNAGKAWNCETVDFSDPDRPPTCLEIDFPILPINQIAAIEGNAGKPIYQMSKWWARRRSSVFRALLLAAATKSPDDPAEAAKQVWESYYGNHQKRNAFKHLKVADIFMGGGTTIVEGSRLGMQMFGNDLNPVAWFIVKNEMAKVDKSEVKSLLAEIEQEVKPQIMPFYTCDCPRGHKGKWMNISSGDLMGDDFDPLTLTPEERKDYSYKGPEVIYTFWAKHGPCQVTGCGHRTPIMTSPVMAIKTISVKYWDHHCPHCSAEYEIEEREARMAPGVALVVVDTERPYAILERYGATCPHCNYSEKTISDIVRIKPKKKKVELTLLVHPNWLKGESKLDPEGQNYGGSADDSVEDTIRWNQARALKCRLIEVRGKLPNEVKCPETGITIRTGKNGGTVPAKSNYVCMAETCGRKQDIRESVKASGKTGPTAMYAIQGYCPECHSKGHLYGGRFFLPATNSSSFNAAICEMDQRKNKDLNNYWPRSEVPYGFMTGVANGDIRTGHGFTHWWKMFNPRQMLALTLLLKALCQSNSARETKEFLLGSFQQHLRNQNMFCFWDIGYDKLVPHMSNNNYHPKNNLIENCVFPKLGRGNWQSCIEVLQNTMEWCENPWELVRNEAIASTFPELAKHISGKSEKVYPQDSVLTTAKLTCGSSTEITSVENASFDFVITDPPFGGLLHYSELADFFYVWMKLVLGTKYNNYFNAKYTPKTLEAVANRARQPGNDRESGRYNADIFYQRLLTACWHETHRILKPGGLLVFTFHHSEDAPWLAVLESLFDAKFYLAATYPIRSDETKGTGEFGSKKIEFDIIHVCRKRIEESVPISWAKMRRKVLQDVRDLKDLLEHHSEEGLPEADLQVIRRGKALEYFSRHYGKIYKDEGVPISVLEALVGINQLLDEEVGGVKEPPPHFAEPLTRMFLRLFDRKAELPRDQMQKFLRGTGSAPSDYVKRGWCIEKKKMYHLISPLEIAHTWFGKHRINMASDYDQAAFLIGACFEGSGINANDTLKNPYFKHHPALSALLNWHRNHGATNQIRNAAVIASSLYQTWERKHQTDEQKQLQLFFEEEGD
jgi:putative DNA methylase